MNIATKTQIFNTIDSIIAGIKTHVINPAYEAELQLRNMAHPENFMDINAQLELGIKQICYSNRVRSDSVRRLLENGNIERVFLNYDCQRVMNLDFQYVIDNDWGFIKPIVRKEKVRRIIRFANYLNEYGSIINLISTYNIPIRINTIEEYNSFWEGFKRLFNYLRSIQYPQISSTTSLLYLLMELGFDCIKPDLIVMKVCRNLQIIENSNIDELEQAVRFIQEYAISRRYRPSYVDLHLLIYGRHSGSIGFVAPRYYNGLTMEE